MPDEDARTVRTVLARIVANREAREELDRQLDADERWIAAHNPTRAERSIEEHLVAIAPREGFHIEEINDVDRKQIATAILDAYLFGICWITRSDIGFKREDPLRVEIRDRRMT